MIEALARQKIERGPVQYAMLALLAQGPRHGYELRHLFEAALGGYWELNSGQIYSSLDRLARDGLVAEESIEKGSGPDKRLWALTDPGRAELDSWFVAPVPREYRLRDELYLKLMLAISDQPGRGRLIVLAQRRELFRELHELTTHRNSLNPRRELASILLLDSAIMHTEAELRWLDIVEARLDDVREQPPPRPPPRPRGRPKKATAAQAP